MTARAEYSVVVPTVGRASLARELLGWAPRVRIREGMRRVIGYFDEIRHRPEEPVPSNG